MTALLDECTVLEITGGPSSIDVVAVEHDSRRVSEGTLFFCLPGTVTDGHRHAAEAVRRGAVALVCEHKVELPREATVAQVLVPPGQARPTMARAAAALYGHPARQLLMAGVTGTNGKTTVTHLLAEVLECAGRPTTVLGTLSGARTTPEAPELQAVLAEVRDAMSADGRPRAVSMEVSSHALAQHRVDAVQFDVAVFTNLTHEHLDFHGSMEEYWRVKSSLFTPQRAGMGVVCVDDAYGRRLADLASIPLVEVSRSHATGVRTGPGHTEFIWRGRRIELALTGEINVINALLAAEAATAVGVEPADVVEGLGRARPVPGRMEVVVGPGATFGPGFTVLVDYAHTPASLASALADARRLAAPGGRVLVAFGCGGERDHHKRPLMGAAAARGADVVVVTTDNPRREDPAAIADQVVSGVGSPMTSNLSVELDRRRAIETLLGSARDGDVVLVTGKGHESSQEIGTCKSAFDDREVVREILALPRRHADGHGGR